MHHRTVRIDAIDRHNSSSSFIKLIRLSFHRSLCHSLTHTYIYIYVLSFFLSLCISVSPFSFRSFSLPPILSLALSYSLAHAHIYSLFLSHSESNSKNGVPLAATRGQQCEHHGHRKYEPDNHDTRGICEGSVIFFTDAKAQSTG